LSETDPAPSCTARHELWRNRLAAAETVYHDAARELREALQEHPDIEMPELRRRRTEARMEYLRVLRIFTDLILRGKRPPL
jgi:hypothetical protein